MLHIINEDNKDNVLIILDNITDSLLDKVQENIIVKDDILSLTLIVKNEAFYIKEWIEFHRMIGVTHFYIYDTYSAELARLRAEIKQKSLQGAEERELEALYVQSVVLEDKVREELSVQLRPYHDDLKQALEQA